MSKQSKPYFHRLAAWLVDKHIGTRPDFIVGGEADPYLLRWFIIPRNPIFNVYLHCFLRSDDDRALHDHPWASVSIILRGRYWEHTAAKFPQKHQIACHEAGSVIIRPSGKAAHRIEISLGETCWTLFITGPRYREWGFHCPQGWVPWHEFVDPNDRGGIGKGCDQ